MTRYPLTPSPTFLHFSHTLSVTGSRSTGLPSHLPLPYSLLVLSSCDAIITWRRRNGKCFKIKKFRDGRKWWQGVKEVKSFWWWNGERLRGREEDLKILRMTIYFSHPLCISLFLHRHDEHLKNSSRTFLPDIHFFTASTTQFLSFCILTSTTNFLWPQRWIHAQNNTKMLNRCLPLPWKQYRNSHPFDSYPFLALIPLFTHSLPTSLYFRYHHSQLFQW